MLFRSFFGASSALANPVMPRTAAPDATMRPLATAIFVKRDLFFIVGFPLLWWLFTGCSRLAITFALLGKELTRVR